MILFRSFSEDCRVAYGNLKSSVPMQVCRTEERLFSSPCRSRWYCRERIRHCGKSRQGLSKADGATRRSRVRREKMTGNAETSPAKRCLRCQKRSKCAVGPRRVGEVRPFNIDWCGDVVMWWPLVPCRGLLLFAKGRMDDRVHDRSSCASTFGSDSCRMRMRFDHQTGLTAQSWQDLMRRCMLTREGQGGRPAAKRICGNSCDFESGAVVCLDKGSVTS
nr:hypothetical protein CFP56_11814 [Quercus suber]